MRSRFELARRAGWEQSTIQRILPDGLMDWLGNGPRWPVFMKDNRPTLNQKRNDGTIFPIESAEDFDGYDHLDQYYAFASGVYVTGANAIVRETELNIGLAIEPCLELHCSLGFSGDPLFDGSFTLHTRLEEEPTLNKHYNVLMNCRTVADQRVRDVLEMYR